MSQMTIKAVWPGERHEDRVELRNNHRGAPLLWMRISKRWLGNEAAWMFDPEKLWPLSSDERLPLHQRMSLQLTYDDAWVRREHFTLAASHVAATLADFPDLGDHWTAIRDAFVSERFKDAEAIGFHWCSANEDPYEGEWNDDLEEYGPPDWAKFWDPYDA